MSFIQFENNMHNPERDKTQKKTRIRVKKYMSLKGRFKTKTSWTF